MKGKSLLKCVLLVLIGITFFYSTCVAIIYVCIDPGHGDNKHGSEGQHFHSLEKNANLKVGLALRDSLNTLGYPDSTVRVIMTRTGDTNPSFQQRAACAMGDNPDSARASQFIIIHHNGDTSDVTNYIMSYVCTYVDQIPGDTTERDISINLVDRVQAKMVDILGYKEASQRLKDSCWYVLEYTSMISAYPEVSFMTCRKIDSLFHYDTTYARKEAGSIYRGWRAYMGDDPIIVVRNHFDGGYVLVDSISRESPFHGAWMNGESHRIGAYNQTGYGADGYYRWYEFCRWQDQISQQERNIYVGNDDEVYTAYFSWDNSGSHPYYIIVQSPNGDESYGMGQIMPICWYADPGIIDPDGNCNGTFLDIYLSRNGGQNYDEIIQSDWPTSGNAYGCYEYWHVTGPPSGQCKIKILAHDDICNNDYDVSNYNFAILCAPQPNSPSNLIATNYGCDARISLYWQDNSTTEDGFNIYRDGQLTGSVGANVTTFTQTGLHPGQSYSYYVKAQRQGCESAPTNTVSSVPGLLTPTAPTNLQVVNVGPCEFRATWQDNSSNEDGFVIKNGTFLHARVDPNITSYQGYYFPEAEWKQTGDFYVYAYTDDPGSGCKSYSNHVNLDPPGGLMLWPTDIQFHGSDCYWYITWHKRDNYDRCQVKIKYTDYTTTTGCDEQYNFWYTQLSSPDSFRFLPSVGDHCYQAQVRGGKWVDCGSYGDMKWSEYPPPTYWVRIICNNPPWGCPYLFVPDGEKYVGENTILAPAEMSTERDLDINDYYLIRQSLTPIDSLYKLRIAEFESEHSFFDQVKLLAVDHDLSTKAAVSAKGEVFVYNPTDYFEPISCSDRNGVNKDSLLQLEPEDKVFLSGSGSLTLNFGSIPSDTGSLIMLAPCCGSPKFPKAITKIASGAEPTQQIGLLVETEGNGVWQKVDSLPPRMEQQEVLVNLSDHTSPERALKIKLSWDERGYTFSKVRCLRAQRFNQPVSLPLISAYHSSAGEVKQKLTSNDNDYAEVLPGQNIDLSFSYQPVEPNKVRDLVFECNGYYFTENTAPDSSSDTSEISQNYPNPFNPQTQIKFTVIKTAPVNLAIYNILGQKVATLMDETLPVGKHVVIWNGEDDSGQKVASGIYFYRLQVGEFNEVRKMILMK